MLVDSTVKDFLAKVAGSDPVPGGGSIAALNGAIAAALAAMVAGLTVGKKGYEENEEQMQRIRTLAIRQKEEFLIDVDRDSEAYNKVFDCFRMPKSTEDEKSARSAAIQEATRFAALVPMQVARNAYELMVIIADVARLGNRNAVTDACVAMMSARSAVLGALMNVRINLGTLKDKAFVAELQSEADELERKTCEKEKELLISAAELQQAMQQKVYEDRRAPQTIVKKKVTDSSILEVDLHITELLDNTNGLSNADMLNYQLEKFHEVLAKYAANKGQKIVFIHGKGDGVLRKAIEKELKTKYKQYYYQDASFREYGFGATMVTIK